MVEVCHMKISQICLVEVSFQCDLCLQTVEQKKFSFFLKTEQEMVTCCAISLELLKFDAVLSGTKYGLRQTRGKFGLGAKMVNFPRAHY